MTDPPTPNATAPRLALSGVGLRDSGGIEELLTDISFSLSAGEFAGIVGASGAGKTSLLRLLNGLSTPTAGEIRLDGRDLQTLAPLTLRRQVVLVLQEPKLLDMTVQAALAYPLQLQKLPAAEIQTRLATWRDRLKIPDAWLERGELQLSVGQRQLVAIARALAMQPRVLLLDEPTSALDVGTADRVLNVLRKSAQREEVTVLMVNHQLELVAQGCDRVLLLADGKLRDDRPTSQIDWSAWRAELVATARSESGDWD